MIKVGNKQCEQLMLYILSRLHLNNDGSTASVSAHHSDLLEELVTIVGTLSDMIVSTV